ncbi:MAG: type I secretion system permease/ATPase [Hyphomicrobiaceae bacterium]
MKHPVPGNARALIDEVARAFGAPDAAVSAAPPADDAPAQPRPRDPLIEALAVIARHHGLSIDPATAIAGLPLEDGRLAASRIEEAAERLGLRLGARPLSARALKPHHCPALAIAPGGSVSLVTGMAARGDIEIMPFDQQGVARRVPRRELAHHRILHVRPANPNLEAGDGAASAFLSPRIVIANRALYSQAIVATIALNMLSLAVPLFTMNVYDRVLPNNAETTLAALAIGALLAMTFEFVLKTLRASLIDTASRRADLVLAMRVYDRVLGARLTGAGQTVGSQANTLREIETIREFNTSVTLAALGDLPFALFFIAMIGLIGGPLVVVPLVAVPLLFLAVLVLQWPLERLHETTFRQMSAKSAVLVEALTGLETIKAAAAEGWAAAKWERAVADQLRQSTTMRLLAGLGMNIVAMGTAAATVAMVVLGVSLVGEGVITAGALMGSMMLLGRAMSPIAQVAALIGRLHSVRQARKALGTVLDAPQERPASTRLLAVPAIRGSVAFEDVTFRYLPDTPAALEGISFSLAPGERVGVLGAIGSGKSSLLKLIANIHEPQSGRILIDGLGLGGLDPVSLRMRTGYLAQDAALFRGTIRENILMHRPGTGDAEMIAAAREAGADAWIGRLGQGFDTPVGERGAGLSGGQKRSLALARALVGRPRLLLLDEPTSEMDMMTERVVLERLAASIAGRTLLLVTHRHTLLPLVERLIVIDRGRIVADGPKADVLKRIGGQLGPTVTRLRQETRA